MVNDKNSLINSLIKKGVKIPNPSSVVTLNIEDDRGDKDTLIFADFKLSSKKTKPLTEQACTYLIKELIKADPDNKDAHMDAMLNPELSEQRTYIKDNFSLIPSDAKNYKSYSNSVAITNEDGKENEIKNKGKKGFPLKILKKPSKSIKDVQPYREYYTKPEESLPERFYYSHCIFKLDERYSVKNIATIKVRKITIEMTESLNPFESKKKIKGDVELFEAFRNNFHSPPTPEVNIKIGKGPFSTVGKILNKYLAGLIGLDFLFTIISVLVLYRDVFHEGYLGDSLGKTLLGLNIFVSTLFVVVLIWILANPFKDFFKQRKLGRPGILN